MILKAVSQIPIQTSMVDTRRMTEAEINWLNEHNTSVRESLLPLLQDDQDREVRDWLKRVCKPKKKWQWTGI